ncbi:MAG: three-Cys-motif partner protein TcmP [Bacteroidales bacterium]|nr:three-Cys-motif partner protein TcmP [Bacteroidales bacterium]
MSDNKNFFDKQTPSSRVKAAIISEYFPQYCKIISRRHVPRKFGYFDMFSGPGMYNDGSLSTPLLVAEKCYEDSFLRDRVWMVFNDMEYGAQLKENFEQLYQCGTFANEPYFASRIFGEWPKIDIFLTRNTMEGFYNECPTLLFIDPWGYKHINTRILAEFLSQWGNEVFIFVNTKRLNAAFEQPDFQDTLKIIFPLTYSEVKENKSVLHGTVEARHKFIVNNLAKEFRGLLGGIVYYTAFQFREENQNTPSHYLLHITKGAKGFELVKQVYNKYANVERPLNGGMEGVETYTYDPQKGNSEIEALFENDFKQENIDILKNDLCRNYSGRTIISEELFKADQKNHLHARSHYVHALKQLVEEKKIEVEYTDGKKHKSPVMISNACSLKFK